MSRIQELEKMLEESPDDPFLIYALAREHESANSTMQALLMYEHLINDHPAYIATYYHYAKLLHAAGNLTGAVKLLQNGIEEGVKAKDMHSVSEMKGLLGMWEMEDE